MRDVVRRLVEPRIPLLVVAARPGKTIRAGFWNRQLTSKVDPSIGLYRASEKLVEPRQDSDATGSKGSVE